MNIPNLFFFTTLIGVLILTPTKKENFIVDEMLLQSEIKTSVLEFIDDMSYDADTCYIPFRDTIKK
jgi:hypothetical protein